MKKTDNRNINIALLGAGTVGGGVYRLIRRTGKSSRIEQVQLLMLRRFL